MTKPGRKPVVKEPWHPVQELTEMQRRFCDYLAYNQGRTTFTKAAIEAGYSENRARIEGCELMKNPKVQRYYRLKCNEPRSISILKKPKCPTNSTPKCQRYQTKVENIREVIDVLI